MGFGNERELELQVSTTNKRAVRRRAAEEGGREPLGAAARPSTGPGIVHTLHTAARLMFNPPNHLAQGAAHPRPQTLPRHSSAPRFQHPGSANVAFSSAGPTQRRRHVRVTLSRAGVPFTSNPPGSSPARPAASHRPWPRSQASVVPRMAAWIIQFGGPHGHPTSDPSMSCRSPGWVRTHRTHDRRPLHAARSCPRAPSLRLVHAARSQGYRRRSPP